MNLSTLLLFLLTVIADTTSNSDEIIVNLKNGAVRGTTIQTSEGKEYFAFLGIPYGEAPVGELRFKAPLPRKPWSENGILDATKDGSPCVQIDEVSKSIIGNEDCLFLNVYTQQYSTEKKHPVMVWIYGGGFRVGHGSSWLYGPSRFIAEGIVMVSLNYRVDALGFLSTNDDAASGNYGLLDQLEALKWVKANIDAFGGDSNQITIFGQSAGSASIFYHVLSPLSEGLFHRAIALSGSPLCPWAFESKPEDWAKKLAKELKCPEDHQELVNCLRQLPATAIVKAAYPFSKLVLIPFPPVLDGKFITTEPLKAFKEGKIHNKVPLITGIMKDEGFGVYGFLVYKLQKYSEDLLKRFVRVSINTARDIPSIIELVKQRYMKNCDKSNKIEFTLAASKLLGDSSFDVCNFETIKHLANAGVDTHSYTFGFAANYSVLTLLGIKEYLGIPHGDDLWYLFDGKLFENFMRNDRVKQMANKLVKLLANYAKYGDATYDVDDVKWPKSTAGNIQVYHINENSRVEKYDPDSDPRVEFWVKTIPESLIQSLNQAEGLKQKDEL